MDSSPVGSAPRSGIAAAPAAPSPEHPVVRGVELVRRFGEGASAVVALRGVSVAFDAGSFTAIMGPSGSGKSTLMHLLAGLDTPTSGSVEIAGTSLDGLADRALTELRRGSIGFVFQAYNLLPVLTAYENVTLPLELAGTRPDTAWVDQLIETVGLTDRRTHKPSELSGGQQQRVAIARALVTRPAVIFADEPTGNLDSRSGRDILELLRRAADELGQAIVMVSHDPAAAAIADRTLFLADGSIVDTIEAPTVERILERLKSISAR